MEILSEIPSKWRQCRIKPNNEPFPQWGSESLEFDILNWPMLHSFRYTTQTLSIAQEEQQMPFLKLLLSLDYEIKHSCASYAIRMHKL